MDVRELRYFICVARSGSFSRAASRLNIAQPALSRQIKKLEDELGVQLLQRHGRGVTITERGALLLSEAEQVIERLSRSLDLVKGGQEAFTGEVAVGVPPTSGLLIVPELYESFRARWPQATLIVREGISTLLEEWLMARRIDVAVMHNPTPLEGIELTPILQERMVLACAPGHPAARPAGIRFRDLADVPLILPTLPHSNRRLLEREAIRHNIRLALALEIDSVPLIKVMVKRGVGATIQTYAGVADETARGEFVVRPIEHPPVTSTICIGMPGEAQASWLTLEAARLVRACVARLVADRIWARARMVEEMRQP
ncbi:LysR family transcriptional regulator [Rhodoplanes sp. TEM]|uniref:LysR family transcriptional regulator n=1 Tax=Rhodoplanes tepidamans TaxID=200616 RepID=A0ABT5JDT6_RHOTP|nr:MULTISPECIES: LysR family transcriptional regulator [Rhodoplanes]MDC7787235.1 LysR family transcriptional regulator [Rhodoplanes tepidamans]MDC7986580.1 LysR family transcriptional regulator [Rhodoplanes sp. TEM]MDQ0357769.1 LysR family nitrogen assimilation transcriptional regulator [Rhodoplanes tepidamans]